MTAVGRPSVASGKPYSVTQLPAGGEPSLELFLGDAEFTVDGTGGPLVVRGHGVPLEDLEGVIRFHEKAGIGGKDVRVWHVSPRDDGFMAESVAAY